MDWFKYRKQNKQRTESVGSAPSRSETNQEKIRRGAEDFADRFEGVMRDLAKG